MSTGKAGSCWFEIKAKTIYLEGPKFGEAVIQEAERLSASWKLSGSVPGLGMTLSIIYIYICINESDKISYNISF